MVHGSSWTRSSLADYTGCSSEGLMYEYSALNMPLICWYSPWNSTSALLPEELHRKSRVPLKMVVFKASTSRIWVSKRKQHHSINLCLCSTHGASFTSTMCTKPCACTTSYFYYSLAACSVSNVNDSQNTDRHQRLFIE